MTGDQIPSHLKTGKAGEEIAVKYLENKGYKVLDRNYNRKCGEIDIICSTNSNRKIVFVEVKTMANKNIRPEENITAQKQKKLIRTCQLYLLEKRIDPNLDWQIDTVGIVIDKNNHTASVDHMENAIFYA